jgi:quercetin dioxygenase-like cupin family protein
MKVFNLEYGAVHVAPVDNGPRVAIVIDERVNPNGRLAMVRVLIPPGGAMPEHAHGPSEAVVLVQHGRPIMSSGDQQVTLEPGTVVALAVGERVRVDNPGAEPAALLLIFTPPDFVRTLAAWPIEAAVQA